jgi:hypothetical protein
MRANPNIDPKKLRVGITSVIPEASEVVARDASAEPATATIPAPALDSTR